jgi:hypothetical protein
MVVPNIKKVFLSYETPQGTRIRGGYYVTDPTLDLLKLNLRVRIEHVVPLHVQNMGELLEEWNR